MKEFLLVFRRDIVTPETQPTAEKMKAMMKPWQDWLGSIAAQNKLANSGSRLDWQGKIVHPDKTVTNGPYAELKEAVGGFIIVKAASLEEAAEISKGCPILTLGGTVEVRPVIDKD